MSKLSNEFYNKLIDVASSNGMKPEDLLLVMSMESGLNPAAHNANGDASGLIQFMPFILKGVGFKGDSKDFRALEAEKQLDYVNNYVKHMTSLNGGPFKSAAQYYVANFWPAALSLPGIKAQDPNQAIVEENPKEKKYKNVSLEYEKKAYAANKGLDVDHDGIISYGDLIKTLDKIKNKSVYTDALASLKSFTPISEEAVALHKEPSNDNVHSVLDVVQNLLGKVASSKDKMLKISSSDDENKLEFCMIASEALNEEFNDRAKILQDDSNIYLKITAKDNKDKINFLHQLASKFSFSSVVMPSLAIEEVAIKEAKAVKYNKLIAAHRMFLLKNYILKQAST